MSCDYGLFYYLIRIKIKLDLFLIYFMHDTTSYLIIFFKKIIKFKPHLDEDILNKLNIFLLYDK